LLHFWICLSFYRSPSHLEGLGAMMHTLTGWVVDTISEGISIVSRASLGKQLSLRKRNSGWEQRWEFAAVVPGHRRWRMNGLGWDGSGWTKVHSEGMASHNCLSLNEPMTPLVFFPLFSFLGPISGVYFRGLWRFGSIIWRPLLVYLISILNDKNPYIQYIKSSFLEVPGSWLP
jgi:hypothetical protein